MHTHADPRDRFAELKPPMTRDQALAEAHRCLMCWDAPCTRACPTHIEVPVFIKKIASGNLRGSARTILEANIFGASCARVCPTEVLCEGACVYNGLGQKPIEIGRLQRHATDWVLRDKVRMFQPAARNGRKVAVVGGGPAGLSCAAELARLGYQVTVFEAAERAGGLNTYGVAEYKMTAETALREVEWVTELGVEVRTKTRVGASGADVSFAQLEAGYDAIFLGVGMGNIRALGIPGEDLPGVRDALEVIAELKADRAAAAARLGRRVAVIGAGNTAIDAVTQSARLGASEVTLVYRRGPGDMSAYAHEVELARQDGVRFEFFAQPVRVVAGEGGRVAGLECVRVAVKTVGDRTTFEPIPGSQLTLAVDTVIKATGQVARESFFAGIPGLRVERGIPVHDPATKQTTNPRYFVGGDGANGGAEVVNAVAEGKSAARGIHQYLNAAQAKVA